MYAITKYKVMHGCNLKKSEDTKSGPEHPTMNEEYESGGATTTSSS